MNLENIQEKLEKLTKKWWFYAILLLGSFFLPLISEKPHGYEQIPQIVIAVLSQALAPYQLIAIILRFVFLVLIVLLVIYKDKISRCLSAFIAVNYLLVALLQNIAYTVEYGMVIILNNMALDIIVVIFWIWEIIIHENDLTPEKQPAWKYWVVPLTLLAFWWPMNAQAMPDFNPLYLITSDAMLTFCAITPIYLAIFSFFHLKINKVTVRITSFIGIYFGVMNMTYAFADPIQFWWLGILHVPLLTISLYMFILSIFK
ncbi:MAG: hypothetical protein ACTSRI_21595 [Promethearchaeota archaeon]